MAQESRTGAGDAAKAADLLVAVAESLNERLALTAGELGRSQRLDQRRRLGRKGP